VASTTTTRPRAATGRAGSKAYRHRKPTATAASTAWFPIRERLGATEFLGYETETAEGVVTALIRDGKEVAELKAGETGAVVVNQTPFYGESGGQIGDTGVMHADVDGLDATPCEAVDRRLQIPGTRKRRGGIGQILAVHHVDDRVPDAALIGRRQIDVDLAPVSPLPRPDILQRALDHSSGRSGGGTVAKKSR
jgi:hypothetical protein